MTHPFANTIPVAPKKSVNTHASRGRYAEILYVGKKPAAEIIKKFRACLPQAFASLDNKRRGDALNLDLYG